MADEITSDTKKTPVTRRRVLLGSAGTLAALAAACGIYYVGYSATKDSAEDDQSSAGVDTAINYSYPSDTGNANDIGIGLLGAAVVTNSNQEYRGFAQDVQIDVSDITRVENDLVHTNLYVPLGFQPDGTHPLFVSLTGFGGFYFQGVGQNLMSEDFVFEAQNYLGGAVIVAPQFDSYGEDAARQVIGLTKLLLEKLQLNRAEVYIEGYSFGGETLSLVLAEAAKLYKRALWCSSMWIGSLDAVVAHKLPIYLVVGADDEEYGSEPAKTCAHDLRALYEDRGLSSQEISKLVVLDVKEESYWTEAHATSQHGDGARVFAHDSKIMHWLFAS